VKFRRLFASNPLPVWVYDLETLAFIEVNVAVQRSTLQQSGRLKTGDSTILGRRPAAAGRVAAAAIAVTPGRRARWASP